MDYGPARNHSDELMVGKLESTAEALQAKRRNRRRRQAPCKNTRGCKSSTACLRRTKTEPIAKPQKSIPNSLSWGDLDTNSAHYKQLMQEVLPKDNVAGMKSRRSSWALLDIDFDDGVDPCGHVDSTPRERNNAGLNANSCHSKSSWGGLDLDLFGEIDIEEHTLHAQDETERSDDLGSVHPAANSNDDEDEDDDESDAPPQEHRRWLDFDLDQLSDSDSETEAWPSDDDDDSSSEGDDESDSEDAFEF